MFNQAESRSKRKLGVVAAISTDMGSIIMRGGLNNGSFIISSHVIEIDSDVSTFVDRAMKVYDEKRDSNFDFVTNSMLTQLQGSYRRLAFSDPSLLGSRTILFEALDAYFMLREQGRLMLGEERFGLRPDAVERQVNDRGQNAYRLNWDTIRPEVLGTLLLCHGAVVETPYSGRFLKEMYSVNKQASTSNMSDSERAFNAVTKGFDKRNG